jgi:uncharacterized protein YkwD
MVTWLRKSVRVRLAVLAVVLLLAVAACHPNQVRSFQLVNEARIARGVRTLDFNEAAGAKAQFWAEQLAACQCLKHSGTGLGSWDGWVVVGENVGRGYIGHHSAHELHRSFMNSPTHRHNIVNPAWTHMAIGYAERNGAFYLVQVFAQRG